MNEVIGVDGSRSGWVAVVLRDGRVHRAFAARDMDGMLEQAGEASAIAVDMPIGLLDGPTPREADGLARAFVGPRWQSVFPVPPRPVLEAARYADAVALCRRLMIGSVSQQAWALRRKIFEVKRAATDPRVFEVHPEVSFRAMAGRYLRHPKRTWNGFTERHALLREQGIQLGATEGDLELAAVDDVLDAAAAAWSADRWARGVAVSLPAAASDGDRHARPRIWY
jgi:predicted RNase H-like nuclease